MWVCKLVLIALLASILVGQEDQLIDFTYTQLLQEVGSNGDQNDRINIFPDSTKQEQYEFPQVCQLKAQLEEGTDSTGSVVDIFDVHDHLTTLRSKVLYLLRLAEQIKKSKANLREIKQHLQLQEEKGNSSRFNSEVSRLAQKQDELKTLKNKIEDLTFKLNQLIGQYNNNPKNQQFNVAALNYQIESYTAKISYLLQLKDKTKRKIDQQERSNYTAFFQDLEGKMGEQSELIIEIDHILANFSDVSYLKSKIAGLQSKVEALNLYIQEKENCINEKEKARKKGSNEEIKDTMEKLRQKKKQFGKTINKYCEGVAKKLESQIKKLLKVYNLTYSCAQGLTELQNQRSKQLIELQNTRRRLRLIEEQGFDQYHSRYNKTRDDIRFRLQKIKTFTINEYVHNVSQIEELIEQAKTAKYQAQQNLKNLPQAGQSDTTIKELRDLVHQIKLQKAHYCAQYDRYEQRVRHIWKRVHQFQDKQKFASRMRRIYMEEGEQLRNLQDTFKVSSDQIIVLLSK